MEIDPYPYPHNKNKPTGTLRGYTEEHVLRAIYFFEISKELHETFGYSLDQYPLFEYDDAKEKEFFWPAKEYFDYLIKHHKPKYKTILEIDNDTLYVYCDILKESYVGNMKANILRIFPTNKTSNEEDVTYTFHNLIFIPLRVENVDSITISVRNYLGDVIKFEGNDISVLLEFRPIERN